MRLADATNAHNAADQNVRGIGQSFIHHPQLRHQPLELGQSLGTQLNQVTSQSQENGFEVKFHVTGWASSVCSISTQCPRQVLRKSIPLPSSLPRSSLPHQLSLVGFAVKRGFRSFSFLHNFCPSGLSIHFTWAGFINTRYSFPLFQTRLVRPMALGLALPAEIRRFIHSPALV